jgi:hypothetical protein
MLVSTERHTTGCLSLQHLAGVSDTYQCMQKFLKLLGCRRFTSILFSCRKCRTVEVRTPAITLSHFKSAAFNEIKVAHITYICGSVAQLSKFQVLKHEMYGRVYCLFI